MKRILSNVLYTFACCMIITPIHASQLHAQGTIKQTDDVVDIAANVTVSGTVQAPLTVHLPPETQLALLRIGAEATCFGYGIGFLSSGVKELIDSEKKPTPSAVTALEEGLHKRNTQSASTESTARALLDDDEEEPRKSCCSRLRSSRGIRHIAAGLWFIGCGLTLELTPRMFKK